MQSEYLKGSGEVISSQAHRVLRNTYCLLSCTLVFSALMAAMSIWLNAGPGLALICGVFSLILLWLALPSTADSWVGVFVVFVITGLLGVSIGPMLSHYLSIPNGGLLVAMALISTALVFFSLSFYVLTTKKDFSFMGGFLIVSLIGVLVTIIGALVLGLFGIHLSWLSVTINLVIVLLMSGFILYDTSAIIHGGETNYIAATISLYLDILNLFTSLLELFGYFSKED